MFIIKQKCCFFMLILYLVLIVLVSKYLFNKELTATPEEILKETNNKIKLLRLENAVLLKSFTRFITNNSEANEPGSSYEMTRRQILTNSKEFWKFLKSHLIKLKSDSNFYNLLHGIDYILVTLEENKNLLLSNIELLPLHDDFQSWREAESVELSRLVQSRLNYIQSPQECSTAKKVVCNLVVNCGFACQLHDIVNCLILAYANERTFVLNGDQWWYATPRNSGWIDIFEPLSDNCTDGRGISFNTWPANDSDQVIFVPALYGVHPRPEQLPLAVPSDLFKRINRIHGNPSAWWVGQFMKYILKPKNETENYIKQITSKLKDKHPFVGLHIRRSDKIHTEAKSVRISRYMEYVEDYFKQRTVNNLVVKRIFLATDEPKMFKIIRKQYPDYVVEGDMSNSETAALSKRHENGSLYRFLQDLYGLSLSDYLVCTASSNVCRAAYEIMQNLHVDASDRFVSVDDMYYYGGQPPHIKEATLMHTPLKSKELVLFPGDLIEVDHDKWNGLSRGTNVRTGQKGLYPNFKVKSKIRISKFPTYSKVHVL